MQGVAYALARATRHGLPTRLLHGGLALAVVTQLLTSLVMQGPDEARPGDLLFQLHELSGLTAAALTWALWLVVLVRSRGTRPGALLPWLSADRLRALGADIGRHARAAAQLRLPPYDPDGALAPAVHGLGLLLVTAMAASGTLYWLQVRLGLHSAEPDGMLAMNVHLTLANLVWAYLFAHAGLAVLHHLLRSMSLATMWSLRP